MDADMDIDLGDAGQPELSPTQAPSEQTLNVHQPMEVESQPLPQPNAEPLPEKLHLRGVDDMSSAEVKKYIYEHIPEDAKFRLEWIDDTSLNLVFESADITRAAIQKLSGEDVAGPSTRADLELRAALGFSEKPGSAFTVRYAVETDKKAPKAAERSRYYLMNPHEDPSLRRQRRERGPRHEHGDYQRRRYDESEQRRREDRNGYDASLYDEGDDSERSERNRTASSLRGRELFGSTGERPRGRSASPGRDRDGDLEMNEEDSSKRYRRRDYKEKSDRELFAADSRRDLFPDRVVKSGMSGRRFRKDTNIFDAFTSDLLELITDGKKSNSNQRPPKPSSRPSYRRRWDRYRPRHCRWESGKQDNQAERWSRSGEQNNKHREIEAVSGGTVS